MKIQEILVLIQTGVGIISLIVSLITLNKVNKIEIIDKSKKQFSIGKDNKQKMK